VDERLTLRLGTEVPVVPVLLRRVNRVGGTVVLDHGGVVDRNVGGPPVEVVHRVALLTHHPRSPPNPRHRAQSTDRRRRRSARSANGSRIHAEPSAECNDVELVAPDELLPGGLAFPGHRHATLILGTESLFAPLGRLATTSSNLKSTEDALAVNTGRGYRFGQCRLGGPNMTAVVLLTAVVSGGSFLFESAGS
jgi:hypothetical protein